MSRLVLTRKVGETVIFNDIEGGKIQMKFLEVRDDNGNKTIRCRIIADSSVVISRYPEMEETQEDFLNWNEKTGQKNHSKLKEDDK